MINKVNLSDFAKSKAFFLHQKQSSNIKHHNNQKWPTIGIIDLSNKQQTASQNPNITDKLDLNRGQVWKKKELFQDVGLSTLMDISISTVKGQERQENRFQKSQRPKNLRSMSENSDTQIQNLKERRKKIFETALKIGQHKPYDKLLVTDDRPDIFLQQLRKNAQHQKIIQGCRIVRNWVVKRIYNQIFLYDTLKMVVGKRQNKLKRDVMKGWRNYVEQQGERKVMMETIRQKIIKRRAQLRNHKQLGNICPKQEQEDDGQFDV